MAKHHFPSFFQKFLRTNNTIRFMKKEEEGEIEEWISKTHLAFQFLSFLFKLSSMYLSSYHQINVYQSTYQLSVVHFFYVKYQYCSLIIQIYSKEVYFFFYLYWRLLSHLYTSFFSQLIDYIYIVIRKG